MKFTGQVAHLIGGPFDNRRILIPGAPWAIVVNGNVAPYDAAIYERIDLDDGEWSGAYAVAEGRAGSANVAPGG